MMKYTVYRTVNTVNGKFYIGVHKTDNPNDGYLGSGKLIKRAVAKYGEQNFQKEILVIFENPSDAFELEKKLVAKAMSDPLCYNLKAGGEGGFDYLNVTGRNVTGSKKALSGLRQRVRTDPEFAERMHKAWAAGGSKKHSTHPEVRIHWASVRCNWSGRTHKQSSKNLISKKMKACTRGQRNSQFGTCWITRNGENRKIKLNEIDSRLGDGWIRGREAKAGSTVHEVGCPCGFCKAGFTKA
jgi:hypothetical protein